MSNGEGFPQAGSASVGEVIVQIQNDKPEEQPPAQGSGVGEVKVTTQDNEEKK